MNIGNVKQVLRKYLNFNNDSNNPDYKIQSTIEEFGFCTYMQIYIFNEYSYDCTEYFHFFYRRKHKDFIFHFNNYNTDERGCIELSTLSQYLNTKEEDKDVFLFTLELQHNNVKHLVLAMDIISTIHSTIGVDLNNVLNLASTETELNSLRNVKSWYKRYHASNHA